MNVSLTEEKDKIKALIGEIENLPTPPFVFQQITKVLNNPYTSAFDIASIISEDAAITARILKLTNSAYYGLTRKVNNVKQAVVIIGMEALRSLLLSTSLMDAFKVGKKVQIAYTDAYWRHSLSVAIMSKIIGRKMSNFDLMLHEAAFSCGILHDIGKLIIATHIEGIHDQKMKIIEETPRSEMEVELELMKCSHAHIGNYFAEAWELPKELSDGVKFHHNPSQVSSGEVLPYMVHLADYLTHISEKSIYYGTSKICPPFYEPTWEILGLNIELQDVLIAELSEEFTKAETFLRIGNKNN